MSIETKVARELICKAIKSNNESETGIFEEEKYKVIYHDAPFRITGVIIEKENNERLYFKWELYSDKLRKVSEHDAEMQEFMNNY